MVLYKQKLKGLCQFTVFLVLTFVLATEGATLLYQNDQTSTDISTFRFFDGNLAGTEFSFVTLDSDGNGGIAFVKIFTYYGKAFNISVYIPGIEGVDVIGIQTVAFATDHDPIFTNVTYDFTSNGYDVDYNDFNIVEIWEDEALLVTSTGDLTNLYVYQPINPDEQISLHCIHGNDGITVGGDNTNKGSVVDAVVGSELWGREFIIPQVPSRMRGYTIKVVAWEPNVKMELTISGNSQKEILRFNGYEPMEFHFNSSVTATILSTCPLYVMQYTWGGFGDNVGPSALTVLDHRLSYHTHTFDNRPSLYDVYVSISCKRQHLTAIYDYEFDYYTESEIGTSVKLRDEEWVTVVRGPYTSLSPVIFMTIEEEVWLNGRNVTDTALFNVAVYSICKVSMCTGASMVDVAESVFSAGNVGVAGILSRAKGLNDTFVHTIPPPIPTEDSTTDEDRTTYKDSTPTTGGTLGTTAAAARSTQSTSAEPSPKGTNRSDSTDMISTTAGLTSHITTQATANSATATQDAVVISDEGCPCVHVSGVPAGYKANDLTGYYLRKLVTNTLSSVTSFHLHSNRQVYRHERCSSVLFFHDWPASYWLIGPFIGASKGYLLNRDYHPNVKDLFEPWRLYDAQQNIWKDDTAIVANCSCQDYPCAALRLTDDPLYKISGIFYIYGNINDRPVYKHETKDMYISYYKGSNCARPKDRHYWVVGEQVGTRGGVAFAPDMAYLPDDIKVPWSVNVNNTWSEDPDVAVECLT